MKGRGGSVTLYRIRIRTRDSSWAALAASPAARGPVITRGTPPRRRVAGQRAGAVVAVTRDLAEESGTAVSGSPGVSHSSDVGSAWWRDMGGDGPAASLSSFPRCVGPRRADRRMFRASENRGSITLSTRPGPDPHLG
ncbi:hypothetical protein GCM10022245_11680 [Streptomyces mayteni]